MEENKEENDLFECASPGFSTKCDTDKNAVSEERKPY